jgi:hypothetical protein
VKVTRLAQYRREGRGGRRFYTQVDMAIIKQDEAAMNSQEHRGEYKRKNNRRIYVCGCGVEGCFLYNSYTNEELK